MLSQTSSAQNSAHEAANRGWLREVDSTLDRHVELIAALVVALGFLWRLWLARATFFNTDEAWHFALANQASAWLAYKASLTISHPPLLILVIYVWHALGTSDLFLRLPSVIAGAVFCWIFYRWLDLVAGRGVAWAGLILASFLGPMVSTSAEVRQNPLLLMFAVGAIYFFDRALFENSVLGMMASSACLYLAMLSHYSAFFVAGALGVYSIVRMWEQKPSAEAMLTWLAAQTAGVALAIFLYKTHLGRLNSLLNQALLPQQYLAGSYFHKGQDHLLPFLYRGTFGVFRFVFGQTQIGQLALLLFAVGIVLLFLSKDSPTGHSKTRAQGILLLLPFVLNWLAAAAGLYPYGRIRQCMFLAIFCLAGVSVCIGRMSKGRTVPAVALALGIVVLGHAFGTLQDRDAFPLGEQRHEHMDEAMRLIRSQVQSGDVILTDEATSYQLRYYLCRGKPVPVELRPDGFEVFRCEGLQVLSTGTSAGALTADRVTSLRHVRPEPLAGASRIWVVQGGWASGLGEALRSRAPAFWSGEIHSFGRYLEVFQIPPRARPSIPEQQAS